ncbi:MAG: porin family protein [Candidatus Eisenbacteria bacterium]|uniref:Porin family protein n=1 Tax=Eiseniibacteriota bacterium TaxID=2212470 RepID=A0A538TAI5_UNCEI|nr:MAG: porin family protein [Candidatus Eisenbacteria bacterium]
MKRNGSFLVALVVGLGLSSSAAFAAAAPAPEGHGLGFQGLGARLGFVDPEGASSTVALGVHIDAGEFVRNVHVIPMVEYWKVGVGGSDISDFTLATDINVDFPVEGGRLIPYAGGGLGLHIIKFDVPPGFLGDTSDTKLGLNVQGGIKNQVMPNLGIFGEVGYSFVSDVNQLKVMGGFTYNFIY